MIRHSLLGLLGLSLFAPSILTAGLGNPEAHGASLPDPTRPSRGHREALERQAPEEADPSWKVESILISGSRRLAVVNGRITRVGDSISGGRVTAITRTGVIINYRGKRIIVRVVPKTVRDTNRLE